MAWQRHGTRSRRLFGALAISAGAHVLLLGLLIWVKRVPRLPALPERLTVTLATPEAELAVSVPELPDPPPPLVKPLPDPAPRAAPPRPEPVRLRPSEATDAADTAPGSTRPRLSSVEMVASLRDGTFLSDSTWTPPEPEQVALAAATERWNAAFLGMMPAIRTEMFLRALSCSPFPRR